MTLIRVLAIAAFAISFADGHAIAQSRSNIQVPAEFPPASYTGRQYVDSKGCVYIRAGIDGQTSWIPRMTRNRKVICGFKPSLSTAQAQAAPAPTRRTAAAEPVQIIVPREARPQPATAPTTKTRAPAATPARRSAPTAQSQIVRRAPAPAVTVIRPAPVQTARAKAAPAPKPVSAAKAQATGAKTVTVRKVAPQVAQGEPACQGASPISSHYLRAKPGVTVRCGPQTQPHSTVISGGGGAGPTMRPVHVVRATTAPAMQPSPVRSVSPAPQPAPRAVVTNQTRVVPRHVYTKQVNATGLSVPPGYQPVWEDDRLNPERAHQTFAGMAQSDVLWTNTVPRRLIERMTGREVTYRYPGLQYPYTSFEQQRAAGVTVSTRGVVMQEPIRVTRGRDGRIRHVASATPARQPATTVAQRQTVNTPTISTRSVPKTPAKAASHRYVQVGIFADAAQGKRAARKLAQRGLPAKTGTLNRNGKAYTLVVTGPFGTQSQLHAALSKVRAAGYGGAKLRK
ncbi:SPOR domain-containing protein [Roseovarius aestuariivivens]|uniref:SPOR domain-containing protein n=1 Tax=Roseovarius aestuariivivens TaxID=1888910 RepID=UPI00107FFF8B|nr:SPOR domain-containing protein [Roseovarius aestuariivivens]